MTSIRQTVVAALPPDGRLLLAVSGGVDSMVMLDAAANAVDRERLIVATFDHGTGESAAAASALVMERAASLGLDVRTGRANEPLSSEASLRAARWAFLHRIAAEEQARACTAHTADDQIETVLMRVLRGAGARGLAGLEGATGVLRPLLSHTRGDIMAYARARALKWVEDPSNASPRYLRNRLRHELLPAMRRVHPSIDTDLLTIGRAAARWRHDVEAFVERDVCVTVHRNGEGLDVDAHALRGLSVNELCVLWTAIVARGGLTLDRRGTHRAAEFVVRGHVGSRLQLSGGWEVIRARSCFEVRPRDAFVNAAVRPLSSGASLGAWSFRSLDVDSPNGDLWSASLPPATSLTVRSWQAGDTMLSRAPGRRGKVKHYLSRAGVTGAARRGWPVVLAGEEIVWIPGVRRSDAATARAGRSGLPFVCEYLSR